MLWIDEAVRSTLQNTRVSGSVLLTCKVAVIYSSISMFRKVLQSTQSNTAAVFPLARFLLDIPILTNFELNNNFKLTYQRRRLFGQWARAHPIFGVYG